MNGSNDIDKERIYSRVREMCIPVKIGGKDIAEALGYKRPSDAIASHVYEGDKLKRCFTVSGQGRNMLVINESGMYALIFGSKLESAIRFKNWVKSEVLPSIRKYGGYFTGQEEMNDQELLARGYLVALRQIEARIEELEGLIPKGEFFDRFISLGDCTCLRDTAKELEKEIFEILKNKFYTDKAEKKKLLDEQKELYDKNDQLLKKKRIELENYKFGKISREDFVEIKNQLQESGEENKKRIEAIDKELKKSGSISKQFIFLEKV